MFDLTALNGINGFRVEGLNADDQLGFSLNTAGDINNDTLSDLVLGVSSVDSEGRNDAGTVYVIFGQVSGWPTSFNLALLNGSNGFRVEGVNVGGNLGSSVSTAGDINGDGLFDLVLGAHYADPGGRNGAGMVYVIFGQASGWPASFDLTTLNGNNGFRVEGVDAGDYLGSSVSTAGDMHGDGRSDLVLGANNASPGGRLQAGRVYVLFGQAGGWPASFDLTTLNGSNGFQVEGLNEGDQLGSSVSTAGDINGDGRSDLVLGAPAPDYPYVQSKAGAAYVIFGQVGSWPVSFNLTTLNGSNGFHVEGVNADDRLGISVSTAGDMNGDGLSDLVLGADYAPFAPPGRIGPGTAYVIFGQVDSWPVFFNLTTLNGSNGFWVEGVNAVDQLGVSISTAGDMRGNGLSDLVLGAPFADPGGRSGAGTAYVIFGQSGWPASFDLTTLNISNSFRIEGLKGSDYLGRFVSTAGDINSDGRSDVVLGAPGVDLDGDGLNPAGTAYVIFGKNVTTPRVIHNLADQIVKIEKPFNFSIADAFNDPDGDALTYSATHSGGSILPNWLKFNASTGFFSGTSNQPGATPITVTATDPYSLIASTGFNLTIFDNPPQLIHALADQIVEFEKFFSFQIANDTFKDPDGDILTYSATRLENSVLPSWLKFNAIWLHIIKRTYF